MAAAFASLSLLVETEAKVPLHPRKKARTTSLAPFDLRNALVGPAALLKAEVSGVPSPQPRPYQPLRDAFLLSLNLPGD